MQSCMMRRITSFPGPTGDPPLHDLIPLGPALPGALTTAEIDATMAYAEAEKALATRAAYASRLARLRRLVRLQGRHSPASAPGHRRRLPLRLADSGRKASPPSAAGPPRSATTTRWPATSRRPAARP